MSVRQLSQVVANGAVAPVNELDTVLDDIQVRDLLSILPELQTSGKSDIAGT